MCRNLHIYLFVWEHYHFYLDSRASQIKLEASTPIFCQHYIVNKIGSLQPFYLQLSYKGAFQNKIV